MAKNIKADHIYIGASKMHSMNNEIARHGGGRGYEN